MSDPFIGEIRMFGGNFAPVGWLLCAGQILPISQYDALYTLIGTTYGGDGVQTFALPSLGGRVPFHNSSTMIQGQSSGTESVVLTTNTIASHTHFVATTGAAGNAATPGNAMMADQGPGGLSVFGYQPYDGTNQATLVPGTVSNAGNSQPHSNIQPYLAVTFIIAMEGIFPSQG